MVFHTRSPLPPVEQVHPAERAQQLAEIANRAFDRYKGQFDDLEKAIGMLMMGDYVGWKVLVIVHNKRTIRKYEEILDINIREFYPEEGPAAMRSRGYKMALAASNFWKVVSGDISIENRRELGIDNNS